MEFHEYLYKKKINADTFQKKDREYFLELKVLFGQISPDSFTQQKAFLLNGIRGMYPLMYPLEKKETTLKKQSTPMIRKILVKPKLK